MLMRACFGYTQAFFLKAPSLQCPQTSLKCSLYAGSFARVYRGLLDGMPVAVKIARDITDSGELDGIPREAAIMSALDHPKVVRQIIHVLAGASRGRPSFSEQSQLPEVRLWMVLEFCDKGSLEVRVFGITVCHLSCCLTERYRYQAVFFRCRGLVLRLLSPNRPQLTLQCDYQYRILLKMF